jgi:hypothetical protein
VALRSGYEPFTAMPLRLCGGKNYPYICRYVGLSVAGYFENIYLVSFDNFFVRF